MMSRLPNSPWTDYLHIFTLSAFAISQPVFSVLAQFPEFFAANHASTGDIFRLTLLLTLLVPFTLVAFEFTCGLLHRRAHSTVHLLLIGTLFTLLALPVANKIEGLSDVLRIFGALAIGGTSTWVYSQFLTARKILGVASIALLVFPLNFLFLSPVRDLLFPTPQVVETNEISIGDTNIVMVVFDELPLLSLMDNSRQIDSARYPNFAALAQESTWYRNATTVASGTLRALPAILTGRLPKKKAKLATEEHFPESLFTFLGPSHRMNVWESITSICPHQLCPEKHAVSKKSLLALATDVAIVYLHIVTPEPFTSQLPDVSQNWGNFLSAREDSEKPKKTRWLKDIVGPWQKNNDEVEVFRRFVDSLEYTELPALNYIHVLLPHVPFRYLPSGKRYQSRLWSKAPDTGKNSDDTWVHEWAAARSFQQSLLQLGYVDTLLGELTARLKSHGNWENTLLIIVSDHGASYRVNDKRRTLTDTNYMALLPVILLVKYPNQSQGIVTDANVEITDILPTLADSLNRQLPFEVDGVSVHRSGSEAKVTKRAFSKKVNDLVHFDPVMDEKYDYLSYQVDLLGSGANPVIIYGMGLRRDLLGKGAGAIKENKTLRIKMDAPEQFADIDLSDDFMPVRVSGWIKSASNSQPPVDVAISVNGTIRAVGRTYQIKGQNEFSIIVPEESFQEGRNEVKALVPLANNDSQETEL